MVRGRWQQNMALPLSLFFLNTSLAAHANPYADKNDQFLLIQCLMLLPRPMPAALGSRHSSEPAVFPASFLQIPHSAAFPAAPLFSIVGRSLAPRKSDQRPRENAAGNQRKQKGDQHTNHQHTRTHKHRDPDLRSRRRPLLDVLS